MDTKYTNAIKDNVATMLLYGEIDAPGWSAEMFAEEMSWHNSQGRGIKVYINSPGGSVFGGYSLIQAIIDYGADTHIVGIAASMAGIIAQFGKKRTINDFGSGMIHMPSSSSKGQDRLLEMIAKQLTDILSKRTGKSTEQIGKLMEAETFFDSSEMLAMGLVDEIITTNVAPITNLKEFSMSDLYNVYNSILNKDEMDKIKNHFKLEATATEDQILASIAKLETDVTNGETELFNALEQTKNLGEANKKLAAEAEKLTNEIAESIVNAAIEAGKIEKDKKDVWLDAAKKDPSAVKAQLNSVILHESVQNLFVGKGGIVDKKPEDDIVAWVQSPEGAKKLMDLFDSNKDEYERIWNKYEETLKIKK